MQPQKKKIATSDLPLMISKHYNSFVLIPQIDDNTKISNENYANNETKDTEQDWDNLIENLKAKIEKEKFAIDDLKISKENGIKSCRQEDLIYDFHEVCNVFITLFMNNEHELRSTSM